MNRAKTSRWSGKHDPRHFVLAAAERVCNWYVVSPLPRVDMGKPANIRMRVAI